MSFYNRNTIQDARAVGTFSTRVYGWMTMGLAFTAVIALLMYQTGLYITLLPFWWVWAFATFGVAMAINLSLTSLSVPAVIALFMTYAGLEGLLFGTILPAFASAYGGEVIWSAFATAAGVFGIAVLYGLFTQNDLTSLGRILTFGLIGLIGVTFLFLILSFFMNVQWMHLVISWIGLVIFVGLTAYDAQTIRALSMQADPHSATSYKLSMIMALRMYINVIMIFWYLLQIFASNSRK
jgi:uncharacterized protein